MSVAGTRQPGSPAAQAPAGGGLSEAAVEELVSRFAAAYSARDVDAVVGLFAEDGDWRVGPGTFAGKDAVRRLFEWDVSLSPSLTSKEEGVGIVVKGNVAVRECRIAQTAEGIPVDYPVLTVFEVNEDGKLQHVRSYYDKLGLMHDIAQKYPGIKGWFFKKNVNMLVAQGEKGLKR